MGRRIHLKEYIDVPEMCQTREGCIEVIQACCNEIQNIRLCLHRQQTRGETAGRNIEEVRQNMSLAVNTLKTKYIPPNNIQALKALEKICHWSEEVLLNTAHKTAARKVNPRHYVTAFRGSATRINEYLWELLAALARPTVVRPTFIPQSTQDISL